MNKEPHISSAELAQDFKARFGVQPKIFSAPGRVNLIGEHTDYNDGFVFPSAIEFKSRVAIAPRADGKLVLHSQEFSQHFEFDLSELPETKVGAWCDYVVGVLVTPREGGPSIPGANVLVRGEVPIGSGLSSSAALEVASALAFMSLSGASLPLPQVAKLCQRAENTFVGAKVGIMDQFVSCLGKAGQALLLDCRSLEYKLVPIPEGVRLVICNTMVKHENAGGEYNLRRSECEQGVKILTKWYPGIRALRDVTSQQVEQHSRDLPAVIYKRCSHVVSENERVLESAEALKSGDLRRFGELMKASHRSLRDLYQVSCFELDTMVQAAEGLPGCWGGRMTGGGFGGCTVNLVNASDAESFAARIAERYQEKVGVRPDVYVCSAADGAGVEAEGGVG
ncbi:MAG TPA: galactokinase [Terriglobales bacterium]|nr:galactokinase [Terriglobales bacterium]